MASQVAVFYKADNKLIYIDVCKEGEQGVVLDEAMWYDEEEWETAMEDACDIDDQLNTELGVVSYNFPASIPVVDISKRKMKEIQEEIASLKKQIDEFRQKCFGLEQEKKEQENLITLLEKAKAAPREQRKTLVRDGLHTMIQQGLFASETGRATLDRLKDKYSLVY